MTFLWTLSQMMIVSRGRWSLLNLEWKQQSGLSEPVMSWPTTSPCKAYFRNPPAPLHVHGQARTNARNAGKSLPMRHPEKEGNLCCCVWLHAATNISIDLRTFLGDAWPGKVGNLLLLCAVACRHMPWHSPEGRGIYADACGSVQPLAST